MVDKSTRQRSRSTEAVLNSVTRSVEGIKRQLSKIGAVREEIAIGERKVEQAASGLAQESGNLTSVADDIMRSVANIEDLIKMARQGGSQAAFANERLGEMEEEWSDILNNEIDQVIDIAGGDLEYQVDDRMLRQALEGALEQPLKLAMSGLSKLRRQMILEMILESIATAEPPDSTEPQP